MNPEELADYLRVSLRTIYSYAQRGEIPAIKIVGQWRFEKNEIDKWVDAQRIIPKSTKVRNEVENEVSRCIDQIIDALALSDIPIDIKMLSDKRFTKNNIDGAIKRLKKIRWTPRSGVDF